MLPHCHPLPCTAKNFTTQFSSYPGTLSSTDDFFQTSHNLMVRWCCVSVPHDCECDRVCRTLPIPPRRLCDLHAVPNPGLALSSPLSDPSLSSLLPLFLMHFACLLPIFTVLTPPPRSIPCHPSHAGVGDHQRLVQRDPVRLRDPEGRPVVVSRHHVQCAGHHRSAVGRMLL